MDIQIEIPLVDRTKLFILKNSWRIAGIVNTRVKVSLNDHQLLIPIDHRFGTWFTDESYLKSRFSDIAAVLSKTMSYKEGAVIDVGTNIGLFLYLLIAADKKRHYVGFEPNILSAAYLQRFIDANKLQNHSVIPMGLSDSENVLELYLSYEVDVSATVIPDVRAKNQYNYNREVLLQQGDNVLPKLLGKEESISLIKIDVEGAEKEVLAGIKNMVSTHRPVIIFESLGASDEAMAAYAQGQTKMLESEVKQVQAERLSRNESVEIFFKSHDYIFFKMHHSGELNYRTTIFEGSLENNWEQNFLAVPTEDMEHFLSMVNNKDAMSLHSSSAKV